MYALSNPPLDSTRPVCTDYDLGHSSIPRWHASMRAARRQGVLEVVRCVTRPLPRVRARTPPVQHLLRGSYKIGLHAFQGGQRHHGRFGTPEEEKGGGGAGGRGEATVGDSVLATPLWGMLYADDTGVVSQSPQQLGKMMGVIVVVCAAFGLTLSEAKTEIMCLRARGMPECLHIKGRLNEGPRLQRKHKDENEVKQNKRNTRERRHDICKPNTRRTQGRATCG